MRSVKKRSQGNRKTDREKISVKDSDNRKRKYENRKWSTIHTFRLEFSYGSDVVSWMICIKERDVARALS